jgi:hypothetical protein
VGATVGRVKYAVAGSGGMGSVDVTLMLDGEVLMRRIIRREDTAMARL